MSVKARCPVCDELVGITPTDKKHHPDRSSRYWRVDAHAAAGAVCEGSGKLV